MGDLPLAHFASALLLFCVARAIGNRTTWDWETLALACKLRLTFRTGQIDASFALWHAQRCFAGGTGKKLIVLAHLEAVLLGSEPVANWIDDF